MKKAQEAREEKSAWTLGYTVAVMQAWCKDLWMLKGFENSW
jgi:hypothetical protein